MNDENKNPKGCLIEDITLEERQKKGKTEKEVKKIFKERE